jgi:hypothetical protein
MGGGKGRHATASATTSSSVSPTWSGVARALLERYQTMQKAAKEIGSKGLRKVRQFDFMEQ